MYMRYKDVMLKYKLLPLMLLLTCLTARGFDFADTLPSGQVLYYSYVAGGVEVVHPNSNVSSGWVGYVKPTGALVVPSSVTCGGTTYAVVGVDDYAFRACSGLTEVTLADGIVAVGNSAFYGCSSVTTLTLPASLSTVGDGAFSLMAALADVWLSAAAPPTTSATAFYSVDLSACTLHVPLGTAAVYASAVPWSAFGSVVEGTHSVNITVAVNNAVRGSATGSGSYAPGTVVTLMALPAEGYSFICWNDGDTLNPRLVNAVVDRVYTAMFFSVGGTVTVCDTVYDTLMPTYYSIDIQTDNAQLGLGVGSAVLPAGVEVEVCGLPLEGGRFVMWDDGVVDNPRRVTVTGALTLRALFERTSLATAVAPRWTLTVDGRRLTVHCGAGERLCLYDGQGRCHLSQQAAGETTALLLPSAGGWLVQVGDGVARKIVIE